MIDALRYEWVRIRTVRSTYWLTGIALVFALLVAVAVSWGMRATLGSPEGPTADDLREVGPWVGTQFARAGAPYFLAFLLAMIGILSWGHEYRHGMIRGTLTAVPDRAAVFSAKALTTAALAAVLAFGCAMIGLLAAAIFVDTQGAMSSAGVWKVVLGLVLYTTLFGLCGMATAAIVRNQTGAVALMLLFPSVIEAVIRLLLILVSQGGSDANELARFLPFDAGSQMFARPAADVITDVLGYDPFGPVQGGLVLTLFAAVLIAAAAVLFSQRDA